jgi:hypothetical protein
MAFWTCGFEAGDLTYYTEKGWIFTACSLVTTAGRVHQSLSGRGGSYSLQIDNDARTPAFGVGGRWLHFWMEDFQGTQNLTVTFFRSASTQSSVVFYSAGIVQIRRGANTILDIGEFNPYVPHWIAIELDAQDAAPGGVMSVYVDGLQVVTFSGDTRGTTFGPDWDQVLFDPAGTTWDSCIDDIIVTTAAEGRLDEHFLSPMQADGNDQIQSGAGSTGGAGTFDNIEEIPPTAAYNEFTAAGTDRYTTGNLGYTPANIHSVTVMARAAREGSLDTLQTVCATDTGGGGVTEALGTTFGGASAGAYSPWQDTFNTDPDTTAAWTITGLNDLRVGVKVS